MQPFKALLVALVLGGSAAASAAGNNSQSLTVEPTLEPGPVHAQAWAAPAYVSDYRHLSAGGTTAIRCAASPPRQFALASTA